MTANSKQVGGTHYKTAAVEPWDIVTMYNLDYFLGSALKYILRHEKKGGVQDIQKAIHFLEKWVELRQPKQKTDVDTFIGLGGIPLSGQARSGGALLHNHWDLEEVQRKWVDSTMGARAMENLHGSV